MKHSSLRAAWALLAIAFAFASFVARAQESARPPTPGIDAPPPAGANATDYIVGPGDTLQIFVWRNPELSVTVPVRPDGKISTPLVENMVAIGKSPSQLARDIETVLAEFVRTPQVNVIVSQAVSSFSSVKVVGQVREPQTLPFRQGLRVLDIVLASGGLTEFASPGRAKIVRQEGDKQSEIKINLGKLMNKGDLSQNVELRPGDVLIVPQSLF
jgi:polysaccharide export outer membrane protein